jgi:hypothetical protein
MMLQSVLLTLAILIIMGVAFLVALMGVAVCRCRNERQGAFVNEQRRLVMLISIHRRHAAIQPTLESLSVTQ